MFDTDYSKWKYWRMKKYNYKKALAEIEAETAKLDAEIARKDTEIAKLDAEIARKDAEIVELKAELARSIAETVASNRKSELL